jgi:WD40 repeat protein
MIPEFYNFFVITKQQCDHGFVSGSGDHSITLWNQNDGTIKKQLTGHNGLFTNRFTKWFASGSRDASIMIWNPYDYCN